MKKYIISIALLIIILVLVLIGLRFNNKKSKNNCTDDIGLEEIYYSINSSTNSSFEIVDENNVMTYLPLDFYKSDEYLIASRQDKPQEFYVIIKNLGVEQLEFLKIFIDNYNKGHGEELKDAKLNTHNGFTYVVFSSEYSSVIDGIIRSYMYCE